MKKLVFFAILVVGAMTLITWGLLLSEKSEIRELGKEVGKITAQIALTAGVGGILLQEYNRRRDRKSDINEFKKDFLKRLIGAYARSKKCRRLLRASCRRREQVGGSWTWNDLPYDIYQEQMGEISETQLDFELLISELNTFERVFSERERIRRCIDKMEGYLKTVITEYETARPDSGTQVLLDPSALSRLSDLIAGSPGSLYRKNFTPAFHEALQLVQKERITV